MGVMFTGGESCVANVQGNDAFLPGNVHSNGSIKFQPQWRHRQRLEL